jgi:carbonic anhydrase
VAQHLFGIKNIVVVHHTYCGATTFTPDGIIDAYRNEHHSDISDLYEGASICISDFASSLEHDIRLVRNSRGTPKPVNIYGCVYNIDTDKLSLAVQDECPSQPRHAA